MFHRCQPYGGAKGKEGKKRAPVDSFCIPHPRTQVEREKRKGGTVNVMLSQCTARDG